jgi:hypothetical protein
MLATRALPTASRRYQTTRLLDIGRRALALGSLLVEVWIEAREMQRVMRRRYPFASW